MRVCHICNSFPPSVGGSETHNFSVVKYLLEKDYEVDVIVTQSSKKLLAKTNYDDKTKKILLSPSYSLPELPGVTIHNIFPRPLKVYFDLTNKIKDLEKSGKIDVIDVHAYPLAIPFSMKRKIIFSVHSHELACPRTSPPLLCKKASLLRCWHCSGIPRYFYWKATRGIALSKISKILIKYRYIKEKTIESGVAENKIAFIPNWIDADWITEECRQKTSVSSLGLGNAATTFAYVGRLEKEKGAFLAPEAFYELSKTNSNINLIILGDGELRRKIEDFCHSNNLENKVKLLGRIPHNEIASYFSMVDAFIFPQPGNYDSYNWALLEAMSTLRPMIATSVADIKDLLTDGYNAFIADPDARSIAGKMRMLAENPELGRKLAVNALKTVKERHGMKNLEQYEKLLRELSQ